MSENTTIEMPWDARAKELEPTDGHYCHFAAWCEWFDEWNFQQSEAMQFDLSTIDKVPLYSAFCAAASEVRIP